MTGWNSFLRIENNFSKNFNNSQKFWTIFEKLFSKFYMPIFTNKLNFLKFSEFWSNNPLYCNISPQMTDYVVFCPNMLQNLIESAMKVHFGGKVLFPVILSVLALAFGL